MWRCCLQVVHRDRTMYNARNGEDIAIFLADPSKEHIDAHLENLRYASAASEHVIMNASHPCMRASFGTSCAGANLQGRPLFSLYAAAVHSVLSSCWIHLPAPNASLEVNLKLKVLCHQCGAICLHMRAMIVPGSGQHVKVENWHGPSFNNRSCPALIHPRGNCIGASLGKVCCRNHPHTNLQIPPCICCAAAHAMFFLALNRQRQSSVQSVHLHAAACLQLEGCVISEWVAVLQAAAVTAVGPNKHVLGAGDFRKCGIIDLPGATICFAYAGAQQLLSTLASA